MTSGVSSLGVCRERAFARKDAQQSQVQPLPSKSFRTLRCTYEYGSFQHNLLIHPISHAAHLLLKARLTDAAPLAGVATCVTPFLGFACMECTGKPHFLQRLGQKVEAGIFAMVSRYLFNDYIFPQRGIMFLTPKETRSEIV